MTFNLNSFSDTPKHCFLSLTLVLLWPSTKALSSRSEKYCQKRSDCLTWNIKPTPCPALLYLISQSYVYAVSRPFCCRAYHYPLQEIATTFVGHRQHHLRRASLRVTLLFFGSTFRSLIPWYILVFLSDIIRCDTALFRHHPRRISLEWHCFFLASSYATRSHDSSWCFFFHPTSLEWHCLFRRHPRPTSRDFFWCFLLQPWIIAP